MLRSTEFAQWTFVQSEGWKYGQVRSSLSRATAERKGLFVKECPVLYTQCPVIVNQFLLN